jgi:hypothetical protein
MIPILLSLPVLGILVMLQSAVASRIHLLYGAADLLLLALIAWALQERVKWVWIWSLLGGIMLSITTALPLAAILGGYLSVTGLALLLKRHVWSLPFLAMLITTFAGTLFTQGLALVALWLSGTPLPFLDSLNLVTLPSLLLNLFLALPVYALMSDLANWLYPKEIEV